MLREIVTDFMLFSGIEGFIFCLFFEKVGECRKFKWYEWLILSIGNCLISQLLPPLLYQFVCIIWICSFLHISNNLSILNGLKLSFKSVVFFLIFEMIFAMIYEYSGMQVFWENLDTFCEDCKYFGKSKVKIEDLFKTENEE